MRQIIYNKDEFLLRWAAERIPLVGSADAFLPARALGVMTGPTKKDRLMAVVVFHDFKPQYRTIQLSVAAIDPRWPTRGTVRDILALPFFQYKVHKVWVAIPHNAERVVRFGKALGFIQEAVLKDHFGPPHHATILRMEFKDYERRYLKKSVADRREKKEK